VSAAAKYAAVCRALLRSRGVTRKEGRGFGSGALTLSGRIFAMVSSRDEFVVKLPKARVAELVAAKKGRPFDAGRGRVMKEWLALRSGTAADWTALAEEARSFVSGASR
jgi:hypothetical protein